jgi:hypothetical protein
MVAQIDKQQPAMVANAMAPPRQANRLVDMAVAERAAGVGPVTMHGYPGNRCWRIESGGQGLPRKERQGLPEAVRRGNRMRPQARPPENDGKSGKATGKQRTLQGGAPATRLSIPSTCLS